MKFRLGLLLGVALGASILGVGVLLANAASIGMTSQQLSVRNAGVMVPLSAPTLSQVAAAGGNGGLTSVTSSATLSAGTSNATGTLSFKLWSDASCTVQFGSTSSVPVAGANGVTYVSGALVPMLAGTYRWTVDYSGDADNLSITGGCGVSGSTVVITIGPAAKVAFTQQPGGGDATDCMDNATDSDGARRRRKHDRRKYGFGDTCDRDEPELRSFDLHREPKSCRCWNRYVCGMQNR